jgi:hypothetical protein
MAAFEAATSRVPIGQGGDGYRVRVGIVLRYRVQGRVSHDLLIRCILLFRTFSLLSEVRRLISRHEHPFTRSDNDEVVWPAFS